MQNPNMNANDESSEEEITSFQATSPISATESSVAEPQSQNSENYPQLKRRTDEESVRQFFKDQDLRKLASQEINCEGEHQTLSQDRESLDIYHQRGHSEYSHTLNAVTSITSQQKNSNAIQKQVVHFLENGIAYLNREHAEDALLQFQASEKLVTQFPTQVDDNYIAVMKYNLACCFQRLGKIDQCILSLQEGIQSLDNKIKAIAERTNISFTERSLTQPSTTSQSQDLKDQELMIGNLLHKYRYQCKFNLQVCAVLSQLNKHEQAFQYGEQAAMYAQMLMHKSFELCQHFVEEISRKQNKVSQKRGSLSTYSPEGLGEDELLSFQRSEHCSPYGAKVVQSASIQNQQKSVAQSLQKLDKKPQPQTNNYFANSRNSVNSACNRSQDSQSSTRVNIRRASSANGSLERIHTFNLKLQNLQTQKSRESPVNKGLVQPNKPPQLSLKGANLNVKATSQSRNTTNLQGASSLASQNSNKMFYAEEKTKVLENVILKVQPIINEFQRIMNEFSSVSTFSDSQRRQMFKGKNERIKNQLKISFNEETEISLLKFNHKFKLNVRNMLGVKHQDDWIFNLNIGNVMHLSLMNSDELSAKLDKTHELNKDAMLEKIILLVVSFFCVGTELRFLSQKRDSQYTKKDSEMWHAKSLHISCLFLPEDCPLVAHIVNSYKKHHLTPKLEMLHLKQIDDEKRRKKQRDELPKDQLSNTMTLLGLTTNADNNSSVQEDSSIAMKEIKHQIELLLSKNKFINKVRNTNLIQAKSQLLDQASQNSIQSRRQSSSQSRNSRAQQSLQQQSSLKSQGSVNQKSMAQLYQMNPQLFTNLQSSNPFKKKSVKQSEKELSKKRLTNDKLEAAPREHMLSTNAKISSRWLTGVTSPQLKGAQQQSFAKQNTTQTKTAGLMSRPLSPKNLQILSMATINQRNAFLKEQAQTPQVQNQANKLNNQIINQIVRKKSPLQSALQKQISMKVPVFGHNQIADKVQTPKGLIEGQMLRLKPHQSSQKVLGTQKSPNMAVGQMKVGSQLLQAQKIQKHYQTGSRNGDSKECNVSGLGRYKSQESIPLNEVLSKLQKQQQNFNKSGHTKDDIHMKLQRPNSSTSFLKPQQASGTSNMPSKAGNQQMLGSPNSYSQLAFKNQGLTRPQQHPSALKSYNFQNINFIGNVNIYEKQQPIPAQEAALPGPPRKASQLSSNPLLAKTLQQSLFVCSIQSTEKRQFNVMNLNRDCRPEALLILIYIEQK